MEFSKVLEKDGVYLRAIAESLINRFQHIRVVPTLDTSAYAVDDVLFVAVELPDVGLKDTGVLLENIFLLDEDDEGAEIDLLFLKSEVAIGDANAAYAFPGASTGELLATVKIATTDYVDHGSFRTAEKKELNLILRTPEDSENLWVAGVVRGSSTPTYAAADNITLNFGFRRS